MSITGTRRAFVGGLLSSVAGAALAEAPLASLRPRARTVVTPVSSAPDVSPIPRIAPRVRATLEQLIAAADLDGTVGCVLADASTGEILEAVDGEVSLPPASVTKAVSALYALDTLGGAFRFVTRVFAVGAINDGILDGDLILAGGGDPTLSADHLADLAVALKDVGVVRVTGRLLCWRGALPYAEEIEPSQLDHLGYNPAVSGLNLNYNRVHFEWRRVNGTWQTTMDARTDERVPRVSMARVRIVDRGSPVFATDAPDSWSVARSALGNGGSRWMPVRQPALYAGDVFQTLARDVGITLPAPEVVDDLPEGRMELVQHASPTLRTILQEMLLYSTNLTAEICGLAATEAKFRTSLEIENSAAQMTRWVGETYGVECDFKDHSGLSDENRISASAMAKLLLAVYGDDDLRPIMRRIAMRDADNNRIENYPIEVRAKTGTLNFVSSLAGYVETSDGSDVVFAIFAADLERRARGKAAGDEVPAGSIEWNRRAKRLQQVLLQRWGLTSRDDGPFSQGIDIDAQIDEAQLNDAPRGGVSLDALVSD
ncbi:D-alanyl-D-alanine carboxypeptidase/D-alanyl-D-alanine-endopeptidase [Octadecabacter sp. G9-8]|uniref:D-alanyl-D-alanine carboxypeptidase/D-alanyl-D-alanine-endopeptidase n=1 Tax=Octadecabacter dasysiphoniae TaxID=2909341 RepID=A0ABS9CUH4_9RHOB|nr:D-alanyl-D-alanine carboxypeptidase/D-alanyl-D-alanine-endopeptidase [Octadecabacter dasysiphoniae]MCF2870882.1 D-alanyl-D-alanine carboxypeptidase/D-alanyl-D-alanine-endopeptidase [Octadecabacter dasysiphoniae]